MTEAAAEVAGAGRVRVGEEERLRRWRLLLGSSAAAGLSCGALSEDDAAIDGALEALYGGGPGGNGGLKDGGPGAGSGGGRGGRAAGRTGGLAGPRRA